MKSHLLIAILVLAVLALAACVPLPSPAPGTGGCPTPSVDTQLLRNEEHGYCLLYPKGFEAQKPNPNETVIFVGSLLNVEQPRAYIEVEDAAGRTAAQAADQLVADVQAGLPGFEVRRSAAKVGGEDAVVFENMPGQDISRQVVMVHGGRLYKLTFVPADPAQVNAYQEMEKLYAIVTDSFRFLNSTSSLIPSPATLSA